MDSVQKKINETLNEIRKIDHIRKHLEDTISELKLAYGELKRLDRVLQKELKDVEEIESLSMKGIFHKILGSKEEQVEKERQEYLQAYLKYNEFKKSVEVLEYEREILEKKLKSDTDLKKELEKLKALRENEILRSDPELTKQLSKISKGMDDAYLSGQKIEAVLTTGKKAQAALDSIAIELRKARQWGNWDMMGRNNMGEYFKYGAIDRAKNLSFQAKQHLHRFQQELEQIGGEKHNFTFNIDHFSRFTDIFFDNLISDWVIQQKIVNAISNVQVVKDKLVRIQNSLESDLNDLTSNLDDFQKEKERILLA